MIDVIRSLFQCSIHVKSRRGEFFPWRSRPLHDLDLLLPQPIQPVHQPIHLRLQRARVGVRVGLPGGENAGDDWLLV